MQRYRLGLKLRSFSQLYFVIKISISLFAVLSISSSAFCQSFGPKIIIIEDFQSVEIYPVGDPQSLAIIPLKEKERLHISFDDFSANTQALNYTWVHCNRNWETSGLISSEYLDGFLESQLPLAELCFNTYQPYSHIKSNLPEANCMPRISGNYYLVIFEEDPEDFLLQYPVVIVEQLAEIQSSIHRAMKMEQRETHQEIDILADLTNLSVQNPFEDIQLSIVQNRNWKSIKSMAPRFLRNGYYDFNYNNGENTFNGGNVFRFADSKNIPVPTLRIRGFELKELWTATVRNEKPRGIDPFLFQEDARGGFSIRKQNSSNPEIEADYVVLDIFLEDIENSGHREIYVIGDFNQYRSIDDCKLHYDSKEKAYRGLIRVKQGYLEYRLAEKNQNKNGTLTWDLSWTEGNHWECPNNYTSIIYMREWGKRYDRVIACKKKFTNGSIGLSLN